MYAAATALAACSTSTTDNKPHEQISAPYGVGTDRAECLDWLLVVGRGHLERTLKVSIAHYNTHHPHRALQLEPPDPAATVAPHQRPPASPGTPRDLLGGLLHEYRRAA
jgi:putative transposase